MMMTTYFTAASDSEAISAVTTTPVGEEVLTSVVGPNSEAFTALIQLIIGDAIDDPRTDEYTVSHGVGTNAGSRLVRLSADLVAEIADRDAKEFAELAGPWQRSGALDTRGEVDVADYLLDLQHLSRNAVAGNGGVYAVEHSDQSDR